MPRLFVAIDLPVTLKTRLSELCAGLPSARWVDPEKLHLTLRFIGAVDDLVAGDIAAALRRVEAPSFAVILAGVGHFAGRTLWVGIERNQALMSLQAQIEQTLQQTGLPAAPRPYVPHVKLARLRGRDGLRAFLDRLANFRAEPFEVGQFSLVESHASEQGTRYEHKAGYKLG